jgi:hypothetical protein
VEEEFFCAICRHHKPMHLLAYSKPPVSRCGYRHVCTSCEKGFKQRKKKENLKANEKPGMFKDTPSERRRRENYKKDRVLDAWLFTNRNENR